MAALPALLALIAVGVGQSAGADEPMVEITGMIEASGAWITDVSSVMSSVQTRCTSLVVPEALKAEAVEREGKWVRLTGRLQPGPAGLIRPHPDGKHVQCVGPVLRVETMQPASFQ